MTADFSAVLRLLDEGVGPVYPAAHLIVADGGRVLLDEARPSGAGVPFFDVASLTKALVTTTLCMRHLDAGRLRLDDELRAGGVLVRHALSHSTGLPPWLPLYQRASGRAAIVEHVRALPLALPPGERSVYSDLGMILLGDRLESVAGGQRLDEQWRTVAAELGLADQATFHPPAARTWPTSSERAPGLVHDDNARALEGVAGHAGLFATAAAVSSLAAHFTRRWQAGDATQRAFWSPSGVPGSTWCLGWDRPSAAAGSSQAGDRWPRDGVGHLGFTGCSLSIDPARARWVVLLSNRVYSPTASLPGSPSPSTAADAIKRLRPQLHDAILAALDGAP